MSSLFSAQSATVTACPMAALRVGSMVPPFHSFDVGVGRQSMPSRRFRHPAPFPARSRSTSACGGSMSIQFGVPNSSFSLMPVVCVPVIRISPASRIAFTRATPRQFSPGRQQRRAVCRVASITVGVGSHKSSSVMATGMRQAGTEGPMDKGTRHVRDLSMRNEADHATGLTGD